MSNRQLKEFLNFKSEKTERMNLSRQPQDFNILLIFALTLLIIVSISGETDYQWLARSRHNNYRARHNAKPLHSSDDLNNKAVKCAQYYVKRGVIDHSCPYAQRYGENIWANWGGSPSTRKVVTRSIDGWYREESQYKYRGSQTGTGHFTQMVWKRSRYFGFGIGRSQDRYMTVAVALYNSPGNYVGEYTKNVARPA